MGAGLGLEFTVLTDADSTVCTAVWLLSPWESGPGMLRSCLPSPSGDLIFVDHGLVIPCAGAAVLQGSPGQLVTCRCQCLPRGLRAALWQSGGFLLGPGCGGNGEGWAWPRDDQPFSTPSPRNSDCFPPQWWWTWMWVIAQEQGGVKLIVIPA